MCLNMRMLQFSKNFVLGGVKDNEGTCLKTFQSIVVLYFFLKRTNKIQQRNVGYLFAVKSYSSVSFNFQTIPKFILLAHVS